MYLHPITAINFWSRRARCNTESSPWREGSEQQGRDIIWQTTKHKAQTHNTQPGKAQTHNTQPGPCTVIRVMEMSHVLRGSHERAVSEQLGTKSARFWMRSPSGDLIHSVDQQSVHNLGCKQVNLLLAGLYSLPRHQPSVRQGWGRGGGGWGSVGPT
jgi:hypothetical protein